DAVRMGADAHHATDRIDVAEELLGDGLTDDADLGLHDLVGLGPQRALGDAEAADREVARGRARDRRGDVAIAGDDLTCRREPRRDGRDAHGFARDRASVVLREAPESLLP